MVCDPDEYMPLIERTFSYYHIPYELSYKTINKEAEKLAYFLELIRKQDLNTFVNAYTHGCFFCSDNILTKYIKEFSITYEQLMQPLPQASDKLIKKKDLEKAEGKDKEKLAEAKAGYDELIDHTFGHKRVELTAAKQRSCEGIMKVIRKTLNDEAFIKLKDASLKEQCTYAYKFLFKGKVYKLNKQLIDENIADEDKVQARKQLSAIEAVQHLSIAILGESPEEDDALYPLLSYELQRLETTVRVSYKNGIRVTGPYQKLNGRTKAIILGCCQNVYPRQTAVAGFFDENYILKVRNYPKLVERSDYFEKTYDALLHSYDEVIFSYPASTIDGDKMERSFLIGGYVAQDEHGEPIETGWIYRESDEAFENEARLDKETAKKVFMKDLNKEEKDKEPDLVIPVSPSSISSYIECPFSYFLKRGLHLEEEKDLAIDAGAIGNIQHRLLEKMFNDEITLDDKNIEAELAPYFEFMKEMMPNDKDSIEAMKIRLARGLKYPVNFLNDFRKVDTYKYAPEFRIEDKFKIGENVFQVNGSIDRLDTNDDKFRIVDYKSSDHTAPKKDTRKGLNIQLLSYLYFYMKLMQDKEADPEAFAYLNLKNEKIEAKWSTTKSYNQADDEELRKDNLKYTAYAVDGSSQNADFFKMESSRSPYTKDEIIEIVESVYPKIAKRLLSGDISIDPVGAAIDGKLPRACKYCGMKDICHFGEDGKDESELEDLVEPEEEKEAENAEKS